MNHDFNNAGTENDEYPNSWWRLDNLLAAVLAVALCVLIGWLAAQGF